MDVSLDVVKAIYRDAIDPRAGDGEGAFWWDAVADEMRAVIAAPSLGDAAVVIAWWHHDWSSVSDTSRAAAKRIRQAARKFASNVSKRGGNRGS